MSALDVGNRPQPDIQGYSSIAQARRTAKHDRLSNEPDRLAGIHGRAEPEASESSLAAAAPIGLAVSILDPVLPSLRPVEVPASLELAAGGTLAKQAHAVVQAVADGKIAPGQAAQLVTALGGIAKIVEATELSKRIGAPEAKHGNAWQTP